MGGNDRQLEYDIWSGNLSWISLSLPLFTLSAFKRTRVVLTRNSNKMHAPHHRLNMIQITKCGPSHLGGGEVQENRGAKLQRAEEEGTGREGPKRQTMMEMLRAQVRRLEMQTN